MKKNLWIWAIAALSMAACTSEDAPAPEQIVTENDWISPDGRVVVQLGAESTPAAVISRAPIEGDEITALEELGIFAVNRGATINSNDFEKWPDFIDNILLKNVKALGTENDPLDQTVNFGKRLSLYDKDASKAGAVYYYPIQGTHKYDFYGYQPRVDGQAITLSNGKIGVNFTLDGDIDLITGAAPQAPTVNEDTLYVTEATATTAATYGDTNPIDGYNAKYIRKIKYHNWIIDESQNLGSNKLDNDDKIAFIPNISFEHRLTKLNFQIISSKDQTGSGNQNETTETGGDRWEATKLKVYDVMLQNVPNVASLSIEPDMPIEYTGAETLAMKKNTKENAKNIWVTDSIIPQEYDEDAEYVSAGYLMVPSSDDITEAYNITLNIKSLDATGIPQEQAISLSLEDYTFEAGKSYNIRIALFALQQVYVSATLTDWDEDTTPIEIPVE